MFEELPVVADRHISTRLSESSVTNKTPAGTYSAPGRYEGSFFCEGLIELTAKELAIDSIEMRRRNLVTDAEMPYRLVRVEPRDLSPETECDSGDYAHAFDRCLAEFGWEEKHKLQNRLIDGRYHGLAVVCFIGGGGASLKENARLELEHDGTVTVYVGSAAVGQGLETIIAQIAADSLGLTIDKMRVRHGSTTYLDDGYGSFASRSTVSGGAVFQGAAALLDKIHAAAARRLGCQPDEIEIIDGAAWTRDRRSVALTEPAADGLKVDASFSNDQRLTYAYGTAAAHVGVDPGTGRMELIDYLVVEDVGRIVNPLTLHGQVIGATVQGLGGAFMEDLVYDANGQLLAGSLADYLIPTATDFPKIRAISLEHRPSPTNPLGVKGAGEGGIIPVGGLMANAVAGGLSSLGAEPNKLPLSPPRGWRLANPSQEGE
jgi:carbon-monoxide dehydrogenase large subunit